MTYREAIGLGEKILAMAGIDEVKTDTWLLFEMAFKADRNFYYLHMDEEVPAEQLKEYEQVLKKRAERIPTQYITGETVFMGLPFKVNSSVLIPRPDTEVLVEEALKKMKPGMKVLDMCTGSGCIITSIMHYGKDIEGYASDISRHAINVAKENAKMNQVSVQFETGDLFDHIKGKYDIIVSNPPYIRTEEIPKLMPEVQNFEPVQALDGKEDGLYFYRRIIKEAKDYLNEEGYLLFEIGYDQGQEVSELMEQEGYKNVVVIKDLAGNDRVVHGGI